MKKIILIVVAVLVVVLALWLALRKPAAPEQSAQKPAPAVKATETKVYPDYQGKG